MDRAFPTHLVQEVSSGTDTGLVRTRNEDFVIVEKATNPCLPSDEPAGIYIVADGMGGHEHGEVASRLAAYTVVHRLLEECRQATEPFEEGCPEWLEYAFYQANAAVNARNRDAKTNMGTTLVAAVVVGQEAYIASVGDSRAYHISSQKIQQITHDHSMVQKLVDSGTLTPDQAENYPYKGVLTQAVGMERSLQVDVFTVDLKPGDYLLLCSDGLTKELSDQAILGVIQDTDSVMEACQTLVAQANLAGGHDNTAVVLVRMEDGDEPVFAEKSGVGRFLAQWLHR